MKKLAAALAFSMISGIGFAAPENAEVYFITPQDGATVGTTFDVVFGLKNMGVAPAGIEKANTGHHHLLVDVEKLPAAGLPIPADKQHLHFGGGQTQTTITLEKGTHTLQLNFADHNHVPFAPAVVSKKITVTVQ
ncbi:MAG: DUF4399 domain-containing protein [Venatoribacter sp.]